MSESHSDSHSSREASSSFRNNGALTVEAGNNSDHSIGRNVSNANVGLINHSRRLTVNRNGIEFFLNSAPGFTALPTLDANRTITWTNGGKYPRFGMRHAVCRPDIL